MTLLVPVDGEADALKYFVARETPENLMLRLFVSNTTPAETDGADAFTEANGSGYAPIELLGGNWLEPVDGAPSRISYTQQTFSFDGALGTVYGYYMTRALSGRIALAERLPTPFSVPSYGGDLHITPEISGSGGG